MYKSGGIERVLAGKANYLVSHGYEVAIVTTDQAGHFPRGSAIGGPFK